MEEVKYCRLCLVTKVRMFNISATTDLIRAYEKIISLAVSGCTSQSYACFECFGLLQKYLRFQRKCCRASDILIQIQNHNEKFQVTLQNIEDIDRKENKLNSNLAVHNTSVYTQNIQATENEENIFLDVKSELENMNVNEDCLNDTLDADVNNTAEDKNVILLPFETNNETSRKTKINPKKRKRKTISNKTKRCKSDKVKIEFTDMKIKEEVDDDINFSDIDDLPLSKSLNLEKSKPGRKKGGPKFNESEFEGYATVIHLTPEDALKEVLLRKESNNYRNCPYKCNLCYRGYEAQAAFENHMKKHSLEFGDYECEFCHMRFTEQRFVDKHYLICHKRKFLCKICTYVCFCTYQAKLHMSTHKGKTYPCNECKEVFSLPNSLLMHKRMKHVLQCICEFCGGTFGTQKGLYLHKKVAHRHDTNELLGPNCEDCNIHFATEQAWKRHLVVSPKHQVSNGCEICGETFSDAQGLKCHMKNHARKTFHRYDRIKVPKACVFCNKWLTSRQEYKCHMTTEHPQSEMAKQINAGDDAPFVCETCGIRFKHQYLLSYHQRKHTGERPYSCRICDKTFVFPAGLANHRRLHSNKELHKCQMCDKLFKSKSSMTKHVKLTHLGLRPHKCSMCDKAFLNACDVKLHMKYTHFKVPWPKRVRAKRQLDDILD